MPKNKLHQFLLKSGNVQTSQKIVKHLGLFGKKICPFKIAQSGHTGHSSYKQQQPGQTGPHATNSVTSKKSQNVYQSCPKMSSLEKLTFLTPLQKLHKNVSHLGKMQQALKG